MDSPVSVPNPVAAPVAAPAPATDGAAAAANKVTLIVFSGDMDKVWAAFNIANGAAASGMDVTMFFTFWGLKILKREDRHPKGDNWMTKMFLFMTRGGLHSLKLSNLHRGGMGKWMMEKMAKAKNVASLEEMLKDAVDLGVKIYGCEVSTRILGITREDLLDCVEIRGIATVIKEATGSTPFFI
ncbi:MAG: DsrE/DsrF/DrsH-like family protein [Armatimonadetes bacterium]|nr:DsrE/DsrF/DrsH-like family protein [Armatimonadota bacterium]